MQKRYIVRKYVIATSVIDAARKEKTYKPDEIFVDEDWKRVYDEELRKTVIGFKPNGAGK